MQRVKTPTAAAERPPYNATGTPGFFQAGDPILDTTPTSPGQDWFNMVQEELANVILAAGLALSPTDDTQLKAAISSLIVAQGLPKATAAGTVDAITADFSPDISTGDKILVAVVAAGANTSTAPTLAADAQAAITVVKGNLQPLAPGDIPGAGAPCLFQKNTTANKWVLLNPATGVGRRIRLTGNITIYVATTGNDTTNTGLTVGSPFLTIQRAITLLQMQYDLNGYAATIQVANGTYTAGASVLGPLVGQAGPGGLIFQGNAGSPSSVIINCVGGGCFNATAGSFTVNGFTMQGGWGIISSEGSTIIGLNLVFGACTGAHMQASFNSLILLTSAYTITGSAPIHLYAYMNGIIQQVGYANTLTGTPAFTTFAQVSSGAELLIYSNTYTGSATGARYSATVLGGINTSGGGANYFPGNAVGSVSSGGQYV